MRSSFLPISYHTSLSMVPDLISNLCNCSQAYVIHHILVAWQLAHGTASTIFTRHQLVITLMAHLGKHVLCLTTTPGFSSMFYDLRYWCCYHICDYDHCITSLIFTQISSNLQCENRRLARVVHIRGPYF